MTNILSRPSMFLVLSLVIAACGGSKGKTTPQPTPQPTPETPVKPAAEATAPYSVRSGLVALEPGLRHDTKFMLDNLKAGSLKKADVEEYIKTLRTYQDLQYFPKEAFERKVMRSVSGHDYRYDYRDTKAESLLSIIPVRVVSMKMWLLTGNGYSAWDYAKGTLQLPLMETPLAFQTPNYFKQYVAPTNLDTISELCAPTIEVNLGLTYLNIASAVLKIEGSGDYGYEKRRWYAQFETWRLHEKTELVLEPLYKTVNETVLLLTQFLDKPNELSQIGISRASERIIGLAAQLP